MIIFIGKLRLIADTEICLYYKKPLQEAHNQLWAVRPAAGTGESITIEHPLHQNIAGIVIYSVCNRDWALDICCPEDSTKERQKLILFPHQGSSQNQIWYFLPENDVNTNQYTVPEEPSLVFDDSSLESSMIDEYNFDQGSSASSISCESIGFAHGLSPAKRSSQTSLTSASRNESLEDIYLYQSRHHPCDH